MCPAGVCPRPSCLALVPPNPRAHYPMTITLTITNHNQLEALTLAITIDLTMTNSTPTILR